MAEARIRLVYGGGGVGLMGAVARGAHEAHGEVLGIIPTFLVAQERALEVVEHIIVDNCAHLMVLRPEMFDVVVMTNMNGDILSDLASALIGGLGFAPSANLGDGASIFEAVHGSAPQIAGKDMANPTALLHSSVLMLRHLGEMKKADLVENALLATLEEGRILTPDMAGGGREPSGTKAFTKELIKNLGAAPKSYPRREYKKVHMPEVSHAAVSVTAKDTRPMGVDIFVATAIEPGVLGPAVEKLLAGLPLRLAQISNRHQGLPERPRHRVRPRRLRAPALQGRPPWRHLDR